MDNLVFALNATMPIFFIMVLGYVLRQMGIVSDSFASALNSFVFLIPLPVKVFMDLAGVDFISIWDGGYVLFCTAATIGSILIALALSAFFRNPSLKGEFVIASFRSSSVLLGIAFVNNIYGSSGIAPLMVIASVPIYNIISVIVLTLTKPGNQGLGKAVIKKSIKGILTNPIILAIVFGIIWSNLPVTMPAMVEKTLNNLSATATPMGLIAMGAMFDPKKIRGKVGPVLTAVFLKLFGFCLIFLPFAGLLGFRNEQMVALLVMLGSATTMAGFVMAKNMGHDGTVLASVVMLTTLFSAASLTFWLYLARSLAFI